MPKQEYVAASERRSGFYNSVSDKECAQRTMLVTMLLSWWGCGEGWGAHREMVMDRGAGECDVVDSVQMAVGSREQGMSLSAQ